MSDQNDKETGAPTQGTGYQPPQSPTPAQAQPVEQHQEQPTKPDEFLTKAEFEKYVERFKSETIEEAFRRAQGLYTKGNEKIRQRISDLEETWKIAEESGEPLSEAAKNRQRTALINQAQLEGLAPDGTPQAQQPAQGQPQAQRPPHFFTVDGILMSADMPEDAPELKDIMDFEDWQDPQAFISFTRQKVDEYRQRTASQPSNPMTRMPSAAAGGAAAGGSLEQQYQREMAQLMSREFPPATRQEKLAVRKKWRDKGALI